MVAFPKRRKSSSRKIQSDEEEFVLDEEEEQDGGSSDDDEEIGEEEESSAAVGRVRDGDVGDAEGSSSSEDEKVGVVQDRDVGVANDSSDDDDVGHLPSPQLSVQSRRRRPRSVKDDDDESSSSEEEEPAPSSPQMPRCPSERDAITDEELPRTHICFFPPDGQSRQCFCLDTLRTIALTTSHPQFRRTLTGGGKATFLQPPHFRTKMSDDLLDQIASRFGRDATDPRGEYYNRREASQVAATLWSSETTSLEKDRESFIERLDQYVRNSMKNAGDLYACPLCYIMAHKQLKGNDDDDDKKSNGRGADDKLKRRYPTDFVYDPMTVLGFLDNDQFRIASTFCFKRASQVREHLRNDHQIDTKLVEGGELYKRYKIRESDGLLQRYLNNESCSGRFKPRQGDMLSYWIHGNNYNFLLLASQIPHAALCRELVETADSQSDPEDVEAAQEFLEPATDFFESFADEASDIWDVVASPFRKESKEDIQEFLVAENDDDEEEEVDERAAHRALLVQDELAAFRKSQSADQQRAERFESMMTQEDEEEEDEQSGEEDGEEEQAEGSEEDVKNGGYFEASSSSEEDDWEKKIKNKRIARRSKSLSPAKRTSRRVTLSHAGPTAKKKKRSGSVEDAELLDDNSDENEEERRREGTRGSVFEHAETACDPRR